MWTQRDREIETLRRGEAEDGEKTSDNGSTGAVDLEGAFLSALVIHQLLNKLYPQINYMGMKERRNKLKATAVRYPWNSNSIIQISRKRISLSVVYSSFLWPLGRRRSRRWM